MTHRSMAARILVNGPFREVVRGSRHHKGPRGCGNSDESSSGYDAFDWAAAAARSHDEGSEIAGFLPGTIVA